MWCNKASEACLISTASEHPDLPTFTKTALELKKTLNKTTASFGAFDVYEPGLMSVRCGLIGGITPMIYGERPYADMVKKRLLKEVIDASGYAEGQATKISGKITKIDISVFKPEWNFEVELKSTNGKTLTVEDKYKFEFEFWNNKDKCGQLGDALPAAVQSLTE